MFDTLSKHPPADTVKESDAKGTVCRGLELPTTTSATKRGSARRPVWGLLYYYRRLSDAGRYENSARLMKDLIELCGVVNRIREGLLDRMPGTTGDEAAVVFAD